MTSQNPVSNQIIPKIEDEILSHLNENMRKSALNFIAYLNENELTPRLWFCPGFWIVPYGEHNLFGIHLYGFNSGTDKNGWVFWFFSGDYSGSTDNEVIGLVQKNAGQCVKCTGDCTSQGVDVSLFGKEFKNLCYQFPVRIDDPDNETLEKVKRLIEFWKEIAPRSNGLHVK